MKREAGRRLGCCERPDYGGRIHERTRTTAKSEEEDEELGERVEGLGGGLEGGE